MGGVLWCTTVVGGLLGGGVGVTIGCLVGGVGVITRCVVEGVDVITRCAVGGVGVTTRCVVGGAVDEEVEVAKTKIDTKSLSYDDPESSSGTSLDVIGAIP